MLSSKVNSNISWKMCAIKLHKSLFFVVFLSAVSITQGNSGVFEDIQISVTNIARNLGVPRAGEKCINFLGDINRCEEVSFLECDKFIGITNILEAGVCRVKLWFVIFILALFVLVPIGILSSACCICVCGCR